MSRPTFETGKPHQKATATWVRRRLADRAGRCFLRSGDQSGVLLADAVGMGKTWEALAATALILTSMRLLKRKGHVLIICPPNLVTKWEDELSAGSPFRHRLKEVGPGAEHPDGAAHRGDSCHGGAGAPIEARADAEKVRTIPRGIWHLYRELRPTSSERHWIERPTTSAVGRHHRR